MGAGGRRLREANLRGGANTARSGMTAGVRKTAKRL